MSKGKLARDVMRGGSLHAKFLKLKMNETNSRSLTIYYIKFLLPHMVRERSAML